MLRYIDDESYRRHILTQLNKCESRHGLARSVHHGKRGEIHEKYREGQEDSLSALTLVTNAIVLWNTIYIGKAIDHLKSQGFDVNPKDEVRLSPLIRSHINFLDNFNFTLSKAVENGELRPLNEIKKDFKS